ncbi:MAG: hypothetical protein GXP25_06755 [Planctomycetes bacterium]|nr:hypothetical protein [Planctomycetota bacterium]
MKCQSCKKNEATVHFTDIQGSEKKEVHLCEECAREQTGMLPKVTLEEIFSNLIQQHSKETADLLKTTCPNCGMSYVEFKAGGRLGCASDYVVFEEGLTPLLEKLHHGTQHIGKTPSHAGDDVRRENEIIRLRRELDRAVQREEYEKAAGIRDRIRELTESSDADQ